MDEIAHLVIQIIKSKRQYYELEGSELTDDEYDDLIMQLKELDRDHPVIRLVGYGERYEWWVKHYTELLKK